MYIVTWMKTKVLVFNCRFIYVRRVLITKNWIQKKTLFQSESFWYSYLTYHYVYTVVWWSQRLLSYRRVPYLHDSNILVWNTYCELWYLTLINFIFRCWIVVGANSLLVVFSRSICTSLKSSLTDISSTSILH